MLKTSVVIVWAMTLGSAASAQPSSSTPAAERVTALLQEQKLDAMAARDPQQSGRFVAALYIPPSQLLVISSAHPQPDAVDYRLAQRQYRETYTDLHGSGVTDGRIFIMDLQANGLRRTREDGAPFDIVYRNGVEQRSYDGEWRQHKLTQAEYDARFEKDDAEYARLLNVLANVLQNATSAAEPPRVPTMRVPDAAAGRR